jgi:hypothetical protein
LTAISGRTTSRFLFDAVTHLRHCQNVTLVEPTPSGVRRVIRALRKGEIAGFVADYDFFQNGLPVTFFGRETTLPPGPIRIARDTGALVVPAFSRRSGRGHEISLGEPFEVPKTSDSDADIAAGMEILRTRLEEGIGLSPEQWVLFQRAWPLEPPPFMRVFPVGSPLESELLKRVDAVLPPYRDDVDGVHRERGVSGGGEFGMETPHDTWPDVTPEESADARQYSMGIDWSPADEVYIASFPRCAIRAGAWGTARRGGCAG